MIALHIGVDTYAAVATPAREVLAIVRDRLAVRMLD